MRSPSDGDATVLCRHWRGWTLAEHADAYEAYLLDDLFPHLHATLGASGFLGHAVCRRELEGENEFLVLTWFKDLPAVASFAGEAVTRANISPRARELLQRFDEHATHYVCLGQWPSQPHERFP